MPKHNQKIPGWVPIAGLVVVALFLLTGRGKSNPAPAVYAGTSVVDSPNSPMAPVMSMGHVVDQHLPANQLTPNEPGTAPLLATDSGIQYG
jgi:hypothetical protein